MAHQHILTPRDLHRVRDAEEYKSAFTAYLARQRAEGVPVEAHTAAGAKLKARVDAGRWIVDCDCGAGNSTHPEWGIALCYGCGAVREKVKFPKEWKGVEKELLRRPETVTRNWLSGETVAALKRENAEHGVGND